MRISFENAFGLALLFISVGLIATPYVTGEETLASLAHNKLALFGAAALILFVIYRVAAVVKDLSAPSQIDQASSVQHRPATIGGHKETVDLHGGRVVAVNEDEIQRQKAS